MTTTINTEAHFISLSMEIEALKNRVRNLIADVHWPTDGEWKESVLRTILKRYLPSDIGVGRGFVVKSDGCTSQIDVLIYDTTKPMLYRDGDLVVVTTDAVRGIVEVKSSLTTLSATLEKLADNVEFIQSDLLPGRPLISNDSYDEVFFGLFCYDWDFTRVKADHVLESLQQSADGKSRRVINHISLGKEFFVHYWEFRPELQAVPEAHQRWHAYRMPDMAQGYFIHNVIASVARVSVNQNKSIWFPPEGKEFREIDDIALHIHPPSPTGLQSSFPEGFEREDER